MKAIQPCPRGTPGPKNAQTGQGAQACESWGDLVAGRLGGAELHLPEFPSLEVSCEAGPQETVLPEIAAILHFHFEDIGERCCGSP